MCVLTNTPRLVLYSYPDPPPPFPKFCIRPWFNLIEALLDITCFIGNRRLLENRRYNRRYDRRILAPIKSADSNADGSVGMQSSANVTTSLADGFAMSADDSY